METSLPYILDHAGDKRPLGLVPSDPKWMRSVPNYGDTTELIPESEWVEFNEFPAEIKRKNQNGKGACNGFAAALGVETLRYSAGMPYIELSGWYVYSILCNGWDRGSSIGQALDLLQDKGVAPESLVEYGLINPRRLSDEAHKQAPRFKVEVGEMLTTYEQIGTAIQRRQSINLAVAVGNSFNNLNADGVPGFGRICNHAVHVGLGMKRARNGEWLGLMTNSWGEQWGQNGFCWLPLKYLPTAAYFEAYTLRSIVDDSADNTRPPDPIA